MPKKPLRHVVVFLPGILGSVLQKDGRDVWALWGQAVWGALTSIGASFQDLLLQDDDPTIDTWGMGSARLA